MLDFIWTLPVQLWGTRNKWTLQKILIHGRIRTTNSGTSWFPACTSNPSATETVVNLLLELLPYLLTLRHHKNSVVSAWFNERTVQLRTLPLVPSPTGPHPARGDSGVCMCIHVCLVWSVFPTAFIVPHHLPVCRQLHTDSPAQFDSIWTWRNAHMRSEGSSPTGDRTRVARLAVQCSTDWATPSSFPPIKTLCRVKGI